jgi:hypothetical protein
VNIRSWLQSESCTAVQCSIVTTGSHWQQPPKPTAVQKQPPASQVSLSLELGQNKCVKLASGGHASPNAWRHTARDSIGAWMQPGCPPNDLECLQTIIECAGCAQPRRAAVKRRPSCCAVPCINLAQQTENSIATLQHSTHQRCR